MVLIRHCLGGFPQVSNFPLSHRPLLFPAVKTTTCNFPTVNLVSYTKKHQNSITKYTVIDSRSNGLRFSIFLWSTIIQYYSVRRGHLAVLKIVKNLWAVRAPPEPRWGAHRAPPPDQWCGLRPVWDQKNRSWSWSCTLWSWCWVLQVLCCVVKYNLVTLVVKMILEDTAAFQVLV